MALTNISQCDESHPACVNCVTAQKECSYLRTPGSEVFNEKDSILSPKSNGTPISNSVHLSVRYDRASLSSRSVSPAAPLSASYVNLLHLELFQNVTSNGLAFHDDNTQNSEWITTTIHVSTESFLERDCLPTAPLSALLVV